MLARLSSLAEGAAGMEHAPPKLAAGDCAAPRDACSLFPGFELLDDVRRLPVVLGSWVGVRHLFHLSLFLAASRMVLTQDPSTDPNWLLGPPSPHKHTLAPCSVQRALLTPQGKHGSLDRCGKST